MLRNLCLGSGITQDRLAEAIGVARLSINEIINGRRGVTAVMALRLSRALSTTPDFWLNLQREVDLFNARSELGREIATITPVREPIPDEDLFVEG